MYSLRTSSRPFVPSECRSLPEDDRPTFWLRPPDVGDTTDARSDATPDEVEPVDQAAFCSECGKPITVKVQMQLPGKLDGGRLAFAIAARAITRVDNFGFDGVAAPWPDLLDDRISYVRRLPPSWFGELSSAARKDTDVDPEEEREGSV